MTGETTFGFPFVARFAAQPSHYVNRHVNVDGSLHLQLLCRLAGIVPEEGFAVVAVGTVPVTCLRCLCVAQELCIYDHRP